MTMMNMMIGWMKSLNLKMTIKCILWVFVLGVFTTGSLFIAKIYAILPCTIQSALGCMSFWGVIFFSDLIHNTKIGIDRVKNYIRKM